MSSKIKYLAIVSLGLLFIITLSVVNVREAKSADYQVKTGDQETVGYDREIDSFIKNALAITSLYRSNLWRFTKMYLAGFFDHMDNSQLSTLFEESVKFLVVDVDNYSDKDKDSPTKKAKLLYLGDDVSLAIDTSNRPETANDKFFVGEFDKSDKMYEKKRNNDGEYEVAVRLFPIKKVGDYEPDSLFDSDVIKGCVKCHQRIKGETFTIKQEDIKGAIVFTSNIGGRE